VICDTSDLFYGEIELIRETVTTPKLVAKIIAIAVIAWAMVARRRSKFALE
jgi:hypothetical protein